VAEDTTQHNGENDNKTPSPAMWVAIRALKNLSYLCDEIQAAVHLQGGLALDGLLLTEEEQKAKDDKAKEEQKAKDDKAKEEQKAKDDKEAKEDEESDNEQKV